MSEFPSPETPEPPSASASFPGASNSSDLASAGSADEILLPSQPDYEVLKWIGDGGYGEVHLARDRSGRYWAVKVVHRVRFPADDNRPYEREYNGIRKFEPISQLSESQLQILHVGRRDEAEYFYYIMELADDVTSGRDIRPDTYSARTLKTEMQRLGGRLPARQCCEIGLALAIALENLHQHGLVHRDIKPANIVFVNGRPKLADLGLVTDADKSMSCAGTEGYIPPEGPGSARADLYSFGIVLYEICTGFHRRDFPKLAENLEELPDHRLLLRLNKIVTKACQANLRKRYQSARQMRRDFASLLARYPATGEAETANVARADRTRSRWATMALWVGAAGLALILTLVWRQKRTASNDAKPIPVSLVEEFGTNTLGMRFVSVPGTKVLFSMWKTRVQDFGAFVNDSGYDTSAGMFSLRPKNERQATWHSPGFEQGPTHPVCRVSWNDARAFCVWLTKKEQSAARLRPEQFYRLPSDEEWSAAVGDSIFPWGAAWPPPASAGNYKGREVNQENGPSGGFIAGYQDEYPWTSPVGSFQANPHGLFDLGGNLWEWCEDYYRKELNSEDWRKKVIGLEDDGGGKKYRIVRGGAFDTLASDGDSLSERRRQFLPDSREVNVGFRCVLASKRGAVEPTL